MEPAVQSGSPGETAALVPDLHVLPAAVIGGEGHGEAAGSDSKADNAAGDNMHVHRCYQSQRKYSHRRKLFLVRMAVLAL